MLATKIGSQQDMLRADRQDVDAHLYNFIQGMPRFDKFSEFGRVTA